MRVLVAGASGAIGTRLVPQLIGRGHEVIGTFRSPGNAERVRALGAQPLALDLLDARAVRQAVLESGPEAIVHQATALADMRFGRSLDRSFGPTNRLRTEGTDALLAAAREAGVPRFVAQSFASYRYAREGGPVKTEDDRLDSAPPAMARETNAAMTHLDRAVTDAGGIALRYGGFYGGANDGLVRPVRKRQLPVIGDGGGVSSFIHLDDAAAATVLALECDGAGIYNITDDEPAPMREWLPALAEALGARPPRRVPVWLAAADRGSGRGDDGRRVSRRLEREGQAGAWLDAALPQLAAGLRGRLRVSPSGPEPGSGVSRLTKACDGTAGAVADLRWPCCTVGCTAAGGRLSGTMSVDVAGKCGSSEQGEHGQHEQAAPQAGAFGDRADGQGPGQLADSGGGHDLADGNGRGAIAGAHVQ